MGELVNYLDKLKEFNKEVVLTVMADMSSNSLGFSESDSLPNKKGLYFIFYKDVVIYVGCSYDGDSTIRKRCKQQLRKPNELQLRISEVFAVQLDEARRIIEEELSIKFIDLGIEADSMVYNYEGYCIAAFSPVLNFYRAEKSYEKMRSKQ